MSALLRAIGCLLLLKPKARRTATVFLLEMLSEQFAADRKRKP